MRQGRGIKQTMMLFLSRFFSGLEELQHHVLLEFSLHALEQMTSERAQCPIFQWVYRTGSLQQDGSRRTPH